MQSTKNPRDIEAVAAPGALDLAEISAGDAAATVAPALVYGDVVGGETLTISIDGRPRAGKRAKSCLVEPEPGDRVLCSVDDATTYVLAVLEGAVDTRLVAEGKLEVHAADVSLSGGRIALRGGTVTIASEALKMRATAALAAFDDLRLLGGSVEANIADKAVLLAERVETRATRVLQRAKQLFRFVDELEQARVKNYDMRAEGLAAVRAENTIVSARVLAKLDGEQVKIG